MLRINWWLIVLAAAAVAFLSAVLIGHVRADDVTTFKNSKGQVTGYGTKQGNTTTFSNALGQQTGRAERQRDNTTIFFDAMGRQIGTARRAR
jgi:phosphoglycerol transferase MdoB-like AlkP superfamily enzyme